MWYYLKGLKFLSPFSMQKYARKAAGGRFSVFHGKRLISGCTPENVFRISG